MSVHPTAIVHPDAHIAADVEIGPYSIVHAGARIGEKTVIHSHVVIEANTVIGKENQIFTGVAIGGTPQDLSWKGEFSNVVIGDRNVIREYSSFHRATGGGVTSIGNDNYLMAYMHAGHNVKIGNGCIIANAVQLAGYAELEDKVVVGGMAGIHQFVRIGTMAMVGGYSKNVKDIPPYVKVDGLPSRVFGLNRIALKRNGIPTERRDALKRAYNAVYRSKMNLRQAIEEIEKNMEQTPEIARFLDFLKNPSRQGILSRETNVKALPGDGAGALTEIEGNGRAATLSEI